MEGEILPRKEKPSWGARLVAGHVVVGACRRPSREEKVKEVREMEKQVEGACLGVGKQGEDEENKENREVEEKWGGKGRRGDENPWREGGYKG